MTGLARWGYVIWASLDVAGKGDVGSNESVPFFL